MQKEIWKDITGYEGLYQVSNGGRILSLRTNKIMSSTKDSKGYYKITLSNNAKCKTLRVHRIIADAFINKINGKEFINHIDGDRANNSISNLEWVSKSENALHSYKTLKNKTHNRGFTDEKIKEIKQYLKDNPNTKACDLARKYNIRNYTAVRIKSNITYKHD